MDVSVLNHNTLIQLSRIVTTHFESKIIAMINDQPQCSYNSITTIKIVDANLRLNQDVTQ